MDDTGDALRTPEEMLCFDVYALHRAFGRVYAPLLDPLGLTYPQYLVLGVLWDENPATVGRIRDRLGLETSTLTPLLKRMEGAELLSRRRDRTDERRVVVTLTERGQGLRDRARAIPDCVDRATALTGPEIADLRDRLQRVRRRLLS